MNDGVSFLGNVDHFALPLHFSVYTNALPSLQTPGILIPSTLSRPLS